MATGFPFFCNELAVLHDRGVKDVLKRRLKTYYRKEALSQGIPAKPVSPAFHYYCVMDVEATCEENMGKDYSPEIIELPVLLLDSATGVVVSSDNTCVHTCIGFKCFCMLCEFTLVHNKKFLPVPAPHSLLTVL